MAGGELTVRVLGPVQLIGVDGALVDLPSASQRRLLAALALHASRPVRAEWLCGVLDVTPGALRTTINLGDNGSPRPKESRRGHEQRDHRSRLRQLRPG